jgi:hypothetical protein
MAGERHGMCELAFRRLSLWSLCICSLFLDIHVYSEADGYSDDLNILQETWIFKIALLNFFFFLEESPVFRNET